MNRERILRIAAIVLVVGVLIQFVPVEFENPPVTGEIAAPKAVRAILERSCYDCHSNQTRWPWYSKIAPASWLMAHDVEEAREHLNFSEWNRIDAAKQLELIGEAWEEVDEGEMPLWFYLPLHPEARLDETQRAVLRDWARKAGNRVPRPTE